MSNIPTNLFAFILVLGFLIFAHEAGHFMFAKLFRVRVLVFSFGFGKRLFGFRLLGVKKGRAVAETRAYVVLDFFEAPWLVHKSPSWSQILRRASITINRRPASMQRHRPSTFDPGGRSCRITHGRDLFSVL